MSSVHKIKLKNKKQNIYKKKKKKYFLKLIKLINKHPISYGSKLKLSLSQKSINHLKYYNIANWINE